MRDSRFTKCIGYLKFLTSCVFLLLFLTSCSKTPSPDAIFLVVVDTVRADRLSCYGYEPHATHNIDNVASNGVMFTNAQSVASWTGPSMGAILTSNYPTQLGLVEKPAGSDKRFGWREKRPQLFYDLPHYDWTLPKIMKEAKFHTAAFVNQPVISHGEGFQRDFDDFYYPVEQGEILSRQQTQPNRRQTWSSSKDAFVNDVALVQKFEHWLATNTQKKLFVWLHLLTPHRPHNPPQEFSPLNQENTGSEEGRRAELSAMYDGELRAADKLVGDIIKAIQQHIGLKRSLIVLTSDHGEEFWDHGMAEHGHSLHREVIHVPLIIISPAFPKGYTVNTPVRTIDIPPTLFALTGINVSYRFEGKNLSPIVAGKEEEPPVFSEAMLYGSTERSLIDNGYKIMYDEQSKQWRLFDVQEDPGETVDLSEQLPERSLEMQKALNNLYRRLRRDYHSLSRKYTLQERKQNRQRALEALKSLGYIGK